MLVNLWIEAIFHELAALSVMRASHDHEIPFAWYQRNSQRNTLVVVINGDGELLTSAASRVARKMLPVRIYTGFKINNFKARKSAASGGSLNSSGWTGDFQTICPPASKIALPSIFVER